VRGRYHALRGHWDLAAADFAQGIASAPPDSEEWFEHACLRLIVGDREVFQTLIRKMRQRKGLTSNPFMAYVLARSCIQTAEPVVDPAQVIRWAEAALQDGRRPWYLHVVGAAHYRAGHLDQAIKSLEESNTAWSNFNTNDDDKLQNRLVLAMVHERLGHAAEARALLAEAQRTWQRILAAKTDGAVSLQTPDWLPVQLLRSEAEALVLYDPVFPADPFASTH
jgi:tetratricopeptide (TPR) repeat protein